MTSSPDPGRTAYEARFADHGPRDFDPWDSLTPEVKAIWARVEAASVAPIKAELDEALEEAELVRDDSGDQMRMLDAIAGKLGLAHDEGLDDAGPFLARIDRLRSDLAAAQGLASTFEAKLKGSEVRVRLLHEHMEWWRTKAKAAGLKEQGGGSAA